MKKLPKQAKILLFAGILLGVSKGFSQDPNFHIYLAFGQSNMEGQGTIENQDKTVDSRFQVLEAINCNNLGRSQGSWYPATPPLCRCNTGLSPMDYFGRTLVEKLPSRFKVGVVHVAVAGSKIELWDKDNYQSYVSTVESWMKNMINEYGGNPYARLVDMAKIAQQKGVIKGILLHQGESNTNDSQWPAKVKGIYDDLMNDLGLNPDSVPLIAGEVVNSDQGGQCGSMNSIIAKLPQTLPNSYVVSSSGLPHKGDRLHFSADSYRKLGVRYAEKMLTLLDTTPTQPETIDSVWLEPECVIAGSNWEVISDEQASNGHYVAVQSGLNSLDAAPTDDASIITIPFSVDSARTFNFYARMNAASADDDSYWIKVDQEVFETVNQLVTSGWEWVKLMDHSLSAGEHTLTIAYREDGALLDKLYITNSNILPTDMGKDVSCQIPTELKTKNQSFSYDLSVSPKHQGAVIHFSIPSDTYVSLKVYSLLGNEITELAGKPYSAGTHSVDFDTSILPQKVYLYVLKTKDFSTHKILMLSK